MRSLPMDSRNHRTSTGIARASYVCAMPAAPWQFPTILVATGHKPEPGGTP